MRAQAPVAVPGGGIADVETGIPDEVLVRDPVQLAFLTDALAFSLTVARETLPDHVRSWHPYLAHLPSRGQALLSVTRTDEARFEMRLFTPESQPEARHTCDFVHPRQPTVSRNCLFKVGEADPNAFLTELVTAVAERVGAETDFEPSLPARWHRIEIRFRIRSTAASAAASGTLAALAA